MSRARSAIKAQDATESQFAARRHPNAGLGLARASASGFRAALLAWYQTSARDLPWRRTSDPYRVWISEVMLQQTQVKTVVPYFERFVAAFPTVAALGAAPPERVLKLWEGLGYYSRGRNLHRAARFIVNEHGGALPRTAAEWGALPGVGPYTANAIASITTGEPVAVLDGNVKRVLARLLAMKQSIDDSKAAAMLRQAADRLLDRKRPGDFNQAMMELGARICTPRSPACPTCPVASWCRAQRAGLADRLPVRRRRPRAPEHHEQAVVISRRERYLLVRRPDRGLLANLWGWPTVPVRNARAPRSVVERAARERFGLTIACGDKQSTVRHDFTHRQLWVHVHRARWVAGTLRPADGVRARWVTARQLEALPLSTLDRKIISACVPQGPISWRTP